MLKSPFAFLSVKGRAITPKPNDSKPKGKLRKLKHPDISADTPIPEKRGAESPTVPAEGKDSSPKQPAGILLNGQETTGRPNTTIQPHPQADPSSSASDNPSQDFSEGSKVPRAQTPVSVAPTRLWSSIPSVRRNSFGGGEGNPFTHEWDDDNGRVQEWRDRVNSESDHRDTQKRHGSKVDAHQHDAQEDHDGDNDKQQNKQLYKPQRSLTGENKNRARRELRRGHRETSKVAVLRHGDRVKDSFEPKIYYYVVPADLDIIFQDEDGTEITRVGKTTKATQDHPSQAHGKNIPFVVQDVYGNELFRSWTPEAVNHPSFLPQRLTNRSQGSLHDPKPGMADGIMKDDFVGQLPSPNRTSWKTIIVDETGNQIPLKYAEGNVGRSKPSFPT